MAYLCHVRVEFVLKLLTRYCGNWTHLCKFTFEHGSLAEIFILVYKLS